MKEIILTGAPGAGKTVLVRAIEREGLPVVEEAATDVIALEQALGNAEPWSRPDFIEKILALQLQRLRTSAFGDRRYHDRSPVCTLALAEFLGFSAPSELEAAALASRDLFDQKVLFVRLLDFITTTDARRISLEESRRFEAVHEAVYRRLGFHLIDVLPDTIEARVAAALTAI